jgi:hypothetical protein
MSRQKRAAEAALFLPILLAIGCGPVSEPNQGANQTEPSCIPNQTLACACPDGSQGAMLCTQAGVLTDCQCNSMLAYNAGSGGGSAPAVADSTVTDAPADTGTQPSDPAADPGGGDVLPTDPAADPGAGDPAADAVPPADPVDEPAAVDPAPQDPVDEPAAVDPAPQDPTDNTAVACLLPNSVANFTAMDINPLSPTYNQARNLDDVCNKVIVIYYTMFH